MSDRTSIKSILLLAANPKGTKNLRLQEEEREIKERLRLAGYGKVPINSAGAIRPRDVQQAMLDFNPHVVHFSGHGAGQEGLVFEDAIGQEKLVDSEALAELFELFSDQVECVVLNACYSKFQAEAIAQHIDYVIGMSKEIGDNAAIKFSVGFYTALGAGRPFKFAYKLGCNAIRLELERTPEYLTPIIWEKGQLIDTGQNNLTPKKSQILARKAEREAKRQQPPQPVQSSPESSSLKNKSFIPHRKLNAKPLLMVGLLTVLSALGIPIVNKIISPLPPKVTEASPTVTPILEPVQSLPEATEVSPAVTPVPKQPAQPSPEATEASPTVTPVPVNKPNSEDNLNSAVGVDYSELQNLLAQGKWKEADEETLNVMLKVAGRKEEGRLDTASIQEFSCTHLRTIDNLWVRYSNGRFGFSVQKHIWESVGGTPDAEYETMKRFGDHIQWRVSGDWLDYGELTFSVEAPEGHLPGGYVRYPVPYTLWIRFFSRAQTCRV